MTAVYLSCKQVARSLALSESTVKRLCDDGKLVAVRTPGGHRRISLLSVQAWQQCAGLSLTNEVGAKRENTVRFDYDLCCRYLLSNHREEPLEVHQALNRQTIAAQLCDDVFAPAVVRLGYLNQCNEITNAQVLRGCQRLRGWLCRLSSQLFQPAAGLRAVGASTSGDQADLASLFVELTLRELGWNAESVGAGLSGAELAAVAQSSNADLVWVCYTHTPEREQAIEDNRQLVRQLTRPTKLAIGGGGLTNDLRRQLSFDFFGDSMVHLRNYVQSQFPQKKVA